MGETRLTRDLDEAMLGGVLAGLAAQQGWDVTLVRVVAVLLTVVTAGVPMVVIYIAAWAIIPPSLEADAGGEGEAGDASAGATTGAAATTTGVADEMVAAVREAADRIEDAARIAADAARQAAEEIGEVVRRPRDGGETTAEGSEDSDTSEDGGAADDGAPEGDADEERKAE